MKKQKGITLIALIITIIVMLILVGVSVSVALNGGLFKTAKQAADKTKLAVQEESGLRYEYEIAKAQGTVNCSYKEYLLQKEYEEEKNEGSFTGTYNEYIISKHTLGEAINTENYGKVVNYKSKGEGLDTLKWRLFYQDEKNTYLISETADGKLPVTGLSFYNCDDESRPTSKKDIVKKYKSGADVSVYGQALMPMASGLFTENGGFTNIISTAYLCDPEVWDAYTDAEGKADFAIGSPTVELVKSTYNAMFDDRQLTLNLDEEGYTISRSLKTEEPADGLIFSSAFNSYWMASPASGHVSWGFSYDQLIIQGYYHTFEQLPLIDSCGSRPVVSIPTSEFQNTYTLSDYQ